MGVWIRTQENCRLFELNMVFTNFNKVKGYDSARPDAIYTLGTYESKERALEVLGEIYCKIGTMIPDLQALPYQMPEK